MSGQASDTLLLVEEFRGLLSADKLIFSLKLKSTFLNIRDLFYLTISKNELTLLWKFVDFSLLSFENF